MGCLKKTITIFLLSFFATAILAACQQKRPAVSLAEAKRITAGFQEGTFAAPPRTITDIETLLDENALTNWDRVKADRRAADATPPASPPPRELARFYRDRAKAAIYVGRYTQARRDLNLTFDTLRSAGIRETNSQSVLHEAHLLADLAHAEQFSGRLSRMDRYTSQRLAVSEAQGGDRNLGAYASAAMNSAAIGRLDEAAARIETLKRKMRNYTKWESPFFVVTSSLANAAEGRVLDVQGRHAEAESFLRQTIDMIHRDRESGKDPDFKPLRYSLGEAWDIIESECLNWLSENLVNQGRMIEAEVAARHAIRISVTRFGRYSPYTARALNHLNQAVIGQNRLADSRRLNEAIFEILAKVGVPPGAWERAQVRANMAASEILESDWPTATAMLRKLRREMEKEDAETFDALLRGDPNFGLALIKTGDAVEAVSVLTPAFTRKHDLLGAKHYLTAELGGLLAMARAALGEADAALAGFRAAVPILLQRSRAVAGEGRLRRFRRDRILEAYLEFLAGRGLADEAFPIAGALKGGTVQAAVAESAARAAARDPDLADLARREQDAQKRIEALYALLSNAANAGDQGSVRDLRGRIDRLRGARAALAEEIERRFPDYARLVNPRPPTLAEARAALHPGEALVATYVGADRTYVWAVPRDGAPAFTAAPLGAEEMAGRVARLRAALAPEASTLGDIPAFDVAAAHTLYEKLLAPVAAGWRNAENLLVVAHGPLGHLPFALLPTAATAVDPDALPLFAGYRAVPWLARTHAVTNLPSVAALRALRAVPAPAANRRAFAGFGDPWFRPGDAATAAARPATALASRGALALRGFPVTLRAAPRTRAADSADLSRLPRLAETADELRSIALALDADPATAVFTGRRASEGTVKAMDLSGVRVIAFATHGLVPGDLDGLTQPALALSAPGVTGETEDGLLTLGEILGLRLDADWVVLSACNTGSGDGAGAEAVSGLGRAFFYAGSRALLVSNWPVETTSAKALTTKLFQLQAVEARLSRGQALRRAMVAVMDGPGLVDGRGHEVFAYAHPIFWAPFSVVGDGGGEAGGDTARTAHGESSG